MGTPFRPVKRTVLDRFSDMNRMFDATPQKAGTSNPVKKEEKSGSQEKKETKPQYRYLTEEMLEKYWKMAGEEDMYHRQYELAAYMVYGTVPPGKKIPEKEPAKNKP